MLFLLGGLCGGLDGGRDDGVRDADNRDDAVGVELVDGGLDEGVELGFVNGDAVLAEPVDDVLLLLLAAPAAGVNLLGGGDGDFHPRIDFLLLLCGGLALDVGHEEGGDEGRDKGGNGFDDGRDVVHDDVLLLVLSFSDVGAVAAGGRVLRQRVSVGVEPVLVPAQFLAEALACVGNQIPDAGRKDGRGDVRDGLPVKGCEHIRGDGCCRGYKDGPDGEHLREFEGLPLGLLLCLLALPLAPPAFQLLEQLFHMVTPSLHSSSRAWMPCFARKSFCLCLMSVA